MSDLPFARLEPMKPPFSSTGIDLFGPVMIKQQRARLKRWGALFSCFTTRVIHTEVVEGYDTNSFIVSFQRLVGRRGRPGDVYSDCITNLKGTTGELNIEIQRIKEYSSNEQITIEESDGDILSPRGWKQIVTISNQFWKRWLIEYLLTLQSRRTWNVHQTNIEPGTTVLLKEDNLPRRKWPLAQIINVPP